MVLGKDVGYFFKECVVKSRFLPNKSLLMSLQYILVARVHATAKMIIAENRVNKSYSPFEVVAWWYISNIGNSLANRLMIEKPIMYNNKIILGILHQIIINKLSLYANESRVDHTVMRWHMYILLLYTKIYHSHGT